MIRSGLPTGQNNEAAKSSDIKGNIGSIRFSCVGYEASYKEEAPALWQPNRHNYTSPSTKLAVQRFLLLHSGWLWPQNAGD